MSKFRLLNVSFIFVFASLFSPTVNAIAPENADSEISLGNVKAATLTPIESDKYLSMKTYFRHLFKNMPENDFGSCGFVSLVSCLSYYDSYYNDTIIDEKYDVESSGASIADVASVSPGVTKVKNNVDLYDGEMTDDEIDAYIKYFIITNSKTDFQYKLMYTYNLKVLGKSSSALKFDTSIGMWSYQKLLDEYYGKNKIRYNYITSSQYGSNIKSSSVQMNMKQYVYDMLEEGYPVILHVVDGRNDKTKYYHSIVAYDYDIGVLNCNFGYNYSNYSCVNINNQEFYIAEAGRLDVSEFSELHSTNYVVNGRPYCGCGYSE